MEKLTGDDFSNDKFKFATSKYIKIDSKNIWIQRLSYVGELGYELYVNTPEAKKIYEKIIQEGKNYNISNCGFHALDTMRMESGFLHWGHDISPEENLYEAGLSFTISNKKSTDFIGKKALQKIRDLKPKKKFVMFTLKNSKPGKPLLLHDEPIYLDNQIIGRTTSGNYSFNYKKNLAFGYIDNNFLETAIISKDLYIEVEKTKYKADLLTEPLKTNNYKIL